jgi:hypothetical protein
VTGAGGSHTLQQGGAVFIRDEPELHLDGHGQLFVATAG